MLAVEASNINKTLYSIHKYNVIMIDNLHHYLKNQTCLQLLVQLFEMLSIKLFFFVSNEQIYEYSKNINLNGKNPGKSAT